VTNQVCIFTTTDESEGIRIQEKLLHASVEVLLLSKNDSEEQKVSRVELYVPVLHAEKAKTILKVLHE
jgi:hypothetical protein